MEHKKIFLASSSELKEDREQFEIFISRKNKSWVRKGVFLELVIWEDFLDVVSQTRLQDEYNEAIKECDLFVMLFFSKVGKYTEKEFETAFGQFKQTNKPFIFTYFKDAQVNMSDINDDVLSLLQFKKKLGNLGHFYTAYKSVDELLLKFGQQLEKLVDNKFIEFNKEEADQESKQIVNTANVKGDGNIVIQGVTSGGDSKITIGKPDQRVSGPRGSRPNTTSTSEE